MSLRQLKRLAIALGVLLVAWLGIEIIRDDPGDGISFLEMPNLPQSEIDSIVMDKAVDRISLVRREDGVWLVNGYRADSAAVADLADDLLENVRAELVAQNTSSHGRFTIADGEARRLRVYQGREVVLDLLVGKRGMDFQSVYLRWPDEDEVYVARAQFSTFVDRPLSDWRDKRIVSIQADSIAEISAMRGGGGYTLTRADSGQWNLDGAPADSAAVARLLNQFSTLNASGFPTAAQMDSVDLDQPDRRIVLRSTEQRALAELSFDSTSASGYWVRRSGDSTVYRLDRFRVDQLVPADSTLRGGT